MFTNLANELGHHLVPAVNDSHVGMLGAFTQEISGS